MADESPATMNGTAAAPRSAQDEIRNAIRGFNTWLDTKAKDPETKPEYLRLMNAIAPALIRWRVDETVRETTFGARRDALALMLSWFLANELRRPGTQMGPQIAYLAQLVGEVVGRATMMMVAMENLDAEAAATHAAQPEGTGAAN